MKDTTNAARQNSCDCPACRHAGRRTANVLFAALTFELAQSALLEAGTLRVERSMLPLFSDSLS